jgi:hypothetical protein
MSFGAWAPTNSGPGLPKSTRAYVVLPRSAGFVPFVLWESVGPPLFWQLRSSDQLAWCGERSLLSVVTACVNREGRIGRRRKTATTQSILLSPPSRNIRFLKEQREGGAMGCLAVRRNRKLRAEKRAEAVRYCLARACDRLRSTADRQ